jgi:hypothetical protein
MMRFIDSDDALVADLLASTLELIAEVGGWVAPGTRLISREGQLSVSSQTETGSPLFHIPRESFVRVDEVTWDASHERLEILSAPDHFGDIEMEMLYLQVALHNHTQKLPWLTTSHPWLATGLPQPVINAVRQVLPTFRKTDMSAKDTLWANRCFKISLDSNSPVQRLLIPLVDLLNHHSQGATGSWMGSAFDVPVSKPFGTDECFLNYGMDRDALEMAAVYGFADSSSTIANSAPLTIEVPNIGLLRVLSDGRDSTGMNLRQTIVSTPEQITLSHWTFTQEDSGNAYQLLTENSRLSQSETIDVIDMLRESNMQLLQEIINSCELQEQDESLRILSDAARINLLVLAQP